MSLKPCPSLTLLGLVASLSLLTSCASTHANVSAKPSSVERAETTSNQPAVLERLADDLARADAAYQTSDAKLLSTYLDRLERQGVRPLDNNEPDLIEEWRRMSPPTDAPLRGRALGPAYMRGVIKPQKRFTTEQILLSGKPVSIAVGARPQRGLELRIRNAEDLVICERVEANSKACRFTPVFTQRYEIELQNAGDSDARYFLVID